MFPSTHAILADSYIELTARSFNGICQDKAPCAHLTHKVNRPHPRFGVLLLRLAHLLTCSWCGDISAQQLDVRSVLMMVVGAWLRGLMLKRWWYGIAVMNCGKLPDSSNLCSSPRNFSIHLFAKPIHYRGINQKTDQPTIDPISSSNAS